VCGGASATDEGTISLEKEKNGDQMTIERAVDDVEEVCGT